MLSANREDESTPKQLYIFERALHAIIENCILSKENTIVKTSSNVECGSNKTPQKSSVCNPKSPTFSQKSAMMYQQSPKL